MRAFVVSALLKCSSIVAVCDSRNRTKLIMYEKILTRRSWVGLSRSEKEKSVMRHCTDLAERFQIFAGRYHLKEQLP